MKWEDLTEEKREDLDTWYNVSSINEKDKVLLASLHESGQFRAWDCEQCGERSYYAEIAQPFDWGDFQGVCQSEVNHSKLCDPCFNEAYYERERLNDLLME